MHFSFLKLFFVFVCLSFFALPSHASTVAGLTMFAPGIDNGLVAHWTFDAQDLTTNVRDRIGVYPGMLFLGATGNIATTTIAGPMGQALVFDGVSDFIALPLMETPETYPFAVSSWFKTTAVGTYAFLSMGSVDRASLSITGGNIQYTATNGTQAATLTSPSDYNDGQWHHVVGVSRSATDHELYVDGVSVNTDATSVTGIEISVVAFLGCYVGGSNYMNGALDDIRIYNRGLSLNDVQRLYILGKGMRVGVSTLVVGGATTKIGTTPVAPAGSSLATGLVGHWTFDGKHMYQNVADSSGNANTGRLVLATTGNTATTTSPGILGQALVFDGLDDYIAAPDINALDATSQFTFSFWAKPISLTADDSFISKRGSDTNRIIVSIGGIGYGGTDDIVIGIANGSNTYAYSDSSVLVNGEWAHFTVIYNGAEATNANRIKLYKNGASVVLTFPNTIPTSTGTNTGVVVIGGESGFTRHANSILDDVRLYSRSLSENDVQQLYRTGQPQSFSNQQANSAPIPSDAGRVPPDAFNMGGGGTQSRQLYMNTWTDPNGDSIQYYFERYATASCTGVASENSGWISDPTGLGGFTIDVAENDNPGWRVKARDSYGKESAFNTCYVIYNYISGGSCPYVFGWDGERFNFEIDIFGSGGLGYQKWGLSEFVQPAPNRTYILNNVVPKNGVFEWRIVGDLAEVDYFDYFRMYSYHIPENLDVIVEGPTLGSGLLATSTLHTVSTTPILPVNAVRLDTNKNVTDVLSARDSQKVILNDGHKEDYSYQKIEVDFGDISQYPTKKIIIGGSTTYPQTDEGVARKQKFGLEWGLYVQDAQGVWKKVPKELYRPTKPLSFDSLIAVDISNIFISQNTKIRLEYLYKVYVDYVALDVTEDMPLVVAEEHPIIDSDLHDFGGWHDFDKDGNVPDYYDVDNLDADFEDFPGYYTKFGNVTELLEEKDDKFLIMAKGDEVTVKNSVPKTVVPRGYKRVYMLDVTGFYKALGKTMTEMAVEPMPFSGMSAFPYPETEHYPNTPEYQEYLSEWNTRYLSPEKKRNSNLLLNNVQEMLSGIGVE